MTLFGLTAAAVSAADAGIHKKILSLSRFYDPRPIGLRMSTLIVSNEGMEDSVEDSPEDSGL